MGIEWAAAFPAAIVFGRDLNIHDWWRTAFPLLTWIGVAFHFAMVRCYARRTVPRFRREVQISLAGFIAPSGDVYDVSLGTLSATVGRVGGELASNRSTMIMWP